jgi:hypothetical protein
MAGTSLEFRKKTQVATPMAGPITLENYNQRAHKFAQTSGLLEFPTIEPGTPECVAWERYFRIHLGGVPHAFQMLMERRIRAMTVPAQWPEWFDISFVGSEAK